MRFQLLHKKSPPLKKFRGWVLFFFLLLSVSANAQTITLSVNSASIESVFNEIKRQTGYSFVYTTEGIKKAKPVSLSVKNTSLDKALELLFRSQPLSYSIEQNYVVVTEKQLIESQEKFEIRGRIIDEKGEGIAGASVRIENSNEGTASDDAGNFLIKTEKQNAVIIVSSVGYKTQGVSVIGGSYTTIVLQTAVDKLDETLVIAYGTTTKRTSTGSVSKVSKHDIESQPVSNPIAVLSGRIAGLQVSQGSGEPGTFYTIRLRGQNSIANGNDPLIVVDGVPFPSTTLNGTFGGGGGVANSPLNTIDPSTIESIEVLKDADATAIYGSKGANGVILITTKKSINGKPQIAVSSYAGVGQVLHQMQLLNTPQYLEMRREAFSNDGVTPNNSNARDLLVWDTTRYTDWQKLLIGNTLHIYDAKASYSDGSKPTQFLIGVGYHKETTVLPGDFGEEKFSGNFNINHHSLSSRLSISFSGSFLKNKNVLPQSDLTSNIILPPDAPKIYDSTGKLNWENSTWTNPYSLLLKPFQTNTDNLISTSAIGYKILSNLEVKSTFSLNRISQEEHISNPIRSNNPALVSTGSAGFGSNTINTLIAEPQVSYNTTWLKGRLDLLGGYTIQATNQNALYQQGSGYTSDELLFSLKAAPSVTVSNEINSRYRYLGLFGRLNYSYNNTYLLTATVRRDGSSRYGPNDRFANFGSLGMGWVFTKEKFMKPIHFISYGKLKGSLGTTGNDQIGDYKYLDIYGPTSFPYLGVTTLQPIQLYNPNYGWERVIKREVGLELGFNNDRSLLTVNYYHNTTTNQLILYGLPMVTGFSGVLQNLPARILNKGFEFEFNSSLVKMKSFEWRLNFNLAIPQNKLLSFQNFERSTYANTYIIGQSLFISRKYVYQGINSQTGVYLFSDINKDGKITTPEDLGAVVYTGQQYFGGIQNSFSYKRVNLTILFQFVRQKNAPSYVSRFGKPGVMNNQPVFILDRWKAPGDIATYQKFSNSNTATNLAFSNYLASDASFSDASFIRLKSFELSWEALANRSTQSYNRHLTVFIQGQNILTITRYKGLDPETKSVLPPPAIITAGLRFSL